LIIRYPPACRISRQPSGRKHLYMFLVTRPFFVSLMVRLSAWILLLRPTGFINQALMGLGIIDKPLEMIFTNFAVVIGMVYIFIPFMLDRKSTRLNSSHVSISYAVFCLKKKNKN